MLPPTSSTPSASFAGQRVALRGYERFMTLADHSCSLIAHVMLLHAPPQALTAFLAHLPLALVHTFNRHPRMRALQVPNTFALAEIQADVTCDSLTQHELLAIHTVDTLTERWEDFVEAETNRPRDRYTQLPFYVRAWHYSAHHRVCLMLFSDHYMSDGISGLTVLHDMVSFAATLSRKEDAATLAPAYELPLRPSLLELWLSERPWRLRLSRWAVAMVGKRLFKRALRRYTPTIPPRPDQADFCVVPVTVNSSSACFQQGSPAAMERALQRCKDERVTVFGAIAAAVVLAYYVTKADATKADVAIQKKKKPFKLHVDTVVNMRTRVPTPLAEVSVGCYMATSELASLATDGVDVDATLFWDFCRRLKYELDASLASVALPFTLLFLDANVHSQITSAVARDFPVPSSIATDVVISNIGRYPYALDHKVADAEQLDIESVYVYNSNPNLGSAAIAYVTATDRFNYSMMHKYESAHAQTLFAAFVACLERVGEIESHASMRTVVTLVKKAIQGEGATEPPAAAH